MAHKDTVANMDNNIVANNNNDILTNDDFMENNGDDEEGIENNNESIEKPQEETIQIASNSSNIASGVTSDEDNDRKLYVGGLTKEVTKSAIRNYFSVYGNIESITLMPCRNQLRENGYAFIAFETIEAAKTAKAVSNHSINGKPVNVKSKHFEQPKIFINLTKELEEEDINEYFSKFGKIIQISMPCSKKTNERKGYCVLTYNSAEVVDEVVRAPIHTIKGKEISILRHLGGKNSNKNQNSDSFVGSVQSGGKRKAKQNKHFKNRKNLIMQNFKENPISNPNSEGSSFVEHTFGGQPNSVNRQNFYGRSNFYGRQNFERQNFEGRHNFSGRQQFNDNRQNPVEQYPSVGQNCNVRQNFGNEQRFLPFSQTNNNSRANNFDDWSSNTQNFDSQNSINKGYSNNQVDNRHNNYQQGCWRKYATTDGGNSRNTFSGTSHNFEQRYNFGNLNNANQAVSRNFMGNTNIAENQGSNNNSRGNEVFRNSVYANHNSNNGRGNMNDGFGFAKSPGREGIRGNMRNMNRRTSYGSRGATWTSFNANINPNGNQKYQPF